MLLAPLWVWVLRLTVLILISSNVVLAEGTPLLWNTHRSIPKWIANTTVGFNVGMDLWKNHEDTWKCKAIRLGVANGSIEILKRTVGRTRPDGSDMKSFPSQHTMNSFMSSGWNFQVSLPLASVTAWGQQAGGRHYFTDTLIGALVGEGLRHLC